MKKRRGNSVIEVIVAMTIITFGLVGAYSILNSGQKLATSTENRIKGVNIAREGIELVQNIRDTNWIKFSSDYTHCWNTYNYLTSCIGTSNVGRIPAGSYIAYLDNGLWKLSASLATGTFNSAAYRNRFPVYMNSEGLSLQTPAGTNIPCSTKRPKDCKTIFTREIKITYLDNAGAVTADINAKKMKVNSVVQWTDSSRNGGNYIIDLETILTNWKEDL